METDSADAQLIFAGRIASGIGRHSSLGVPGCEGAPGAPDDWPKQLCPGSLNVRVSHYPDEQLLQAGLAREVASLDKSPLLPAFEIAGSRLLNNQIKPTESDPKRGDAQVWRARIRRPRDGVEVGCWVLRRHGSSVGEQIELLSGERLRDHGFQDGDSVIVVMSGRWNPAYPNADDNWLPCMTMLRREIQESPEALNAARRFFDSRGGPSATTYTVMATPAGEFAWVKHVGDKSVGAGTVCGKRVAATPIWAGPAQISASLALDLARWCAAYAERPREVATTSPSDDPYEAQGIALALRLKAELGNSIIVLYRAAGGDPSTPNLGGDTVEIVADTRRYSFSAR